MSLKRWALASLVGISVAGNLPQAVGRDLKITLPKRSQLTPVQKLNREGVEAISESLKEPGRVVIEAVHHPSGPSQPARQQEGEHHGLIDVDDVLAI